MKDWQWAKKNVLCDCFPILKSAQGIHFADCSRSCLLRLLNKANFFPPSPYPDLFFDPLELLQSLIVLFTSAHSTMADDDHRAKRSRFDQTEPEPRRSRFDRRSRSPSAKQSESTRTRSPLSREPRSPAVDDSGKPATSDPAAAAGIFIS